ncbi:hypothetical protein [Pseudomonas nitroreducens]|nr:hypothetical protein [Pseudomonas nitroreducens]MCP1648426.1 hypothetical protein [Pseudomonas nitroreducens]MCP1687000.1 hypothetical protein [Pseudomonas nitroreducens]
MSLVIDLWKKSLWKKRHSIPSFPTGPAQAAHLFQTELSFAGEH